MMVVAPAKKYECGEEIDPVAEAETERWALSQPRQDLDEATEASRLITARAGSTVDHSFDPDPYDLRRERADRIELAREVVEESWR